MTDEKEPVSLDLAINLTEDSNIPDDEGLLQKLLLFKRCYASMTSQLLYHLDEQLKGEPGLTAQELKRLCLNIAEKENKMLKQYNDLIIKIGQRLGLDVKQIESLVTETYDVENPIEHIYSE